MPAYKRILLKLSGEALAAGQGFGVDPIRVHEIAAELRDVHELGVEIAIVVGGGNFFRGVAIQARDMDLVAAVRPGLEGIVAPKIDRADEVVSLARELDEREDGVAEPGGAGHRVGGRHGRHCAACITVTTGG